MSRDKEEFFEDYGFGESLEKRTLMASAYPALIRGVEKDGMVLYEGFLPGLQDTDVEDTESENECVELLQDILDDKVEELIENERELPDVESDEKLVHKYPGYKIVYLDINVYVSRDDACDGHCEHCDHVHDDDDDEEYDERDMDVYNDAYFDYTDEDDYEYEDDDEEFETRNSDNDKNDKNPPKYMEYRDDD